ncbi:MAG: RagB/SusD family nutrient uptake outer membrane protein [Sediminibacterium sp.]|nr:RagB/SusD family nutrient uptake outer membrane protein [Sediminibacterium sp.]
MRFNKLFIATALTTVVLASTGCKKVLDEGPYNAFTDESVFTTPERALLALNGVYDAAQTGTQTLAGRGYPFGAATIEQGDNRGEDVVNLAAFYQITYQGTYNPSTANNQAMWDNSYNMINKANIAIDGFRSVGASGIISTTLATQYEAECRFLRALAHHELLVHYARPYLDGNGSALGVPYRDYAVTGSAALDRLRTDPRPTVAYDYRKLLNDLDFAEANLPATNSVGKVRATKSAAIALKQRVRMHMGQWDSARLEGNKLIPASINPLNPTAAVSLIGSHQLLASPAAAFGIAGGNSISAENIFSVKNDPLDNGSVNGAMAAMYGSTDLGARGLVAISPIIWNNTGWLADDLRRSTLYRIGGNAISNGIMTTKYTDYVNRGDNTPILRWAEVLLFQAEAEARLSTGAVSQRAVDLLNMVRNRASANPAATQFTTASFADYTELLKAILLERRIEFLAEGRRWPDIHRTAADPVAAVKSAGIPAKVTNGVTGIALYGVGLPVTTGQAAIPYSDYRFIWPIPVGEVTQNPVIVQNPGY